MELSLAKLANYYATAAHNAIGHKRKYTNNPYVDHLSAVACIVATTADVKEEMVAAAWLHDIVEDTQVELKDIYNVFGDSVGLMVKGLTDVSKPSDGNRAVRKEIDRQHLSIQSSDTKTIKLADLIHNSSSIIKYDPNFAKVFIAEKKLLLEVLTEGDEKLHKRATAIVDRYYKELCSE